MAERVVLPDDQDQFKLNEVCKLANVQPYMLRFWGTEFPQLEASKSGTGQRLYSRDQVELILEIRRLLFDEGLTIAGARKKIAAMEEFGGKSAPKAVKAAEPELERELDPEPEPDVEPERGASVAATKTSSARRKKPKKAPAAAKVDKETPKNVQPLLATLKDVRDEIDKIVAELKGG
jgi:DNA-binding transcriptional MerR regulator